MNIDDISSYIRTIFYLLLGVESVFLSHLYWYGYRKVKKSKIIFVLQRLLLSLGVFFLYTSLLPIVRIIDPDLHLDFVFIIPILLLPLYYYLYRFRKETVSDQEIILPEDKKIERKEVFK